MAQLLTLSKAARLVGVKRDALQAKIRQGELKTFEGLLDLNELMRVFPQTQIEDNSAIERLDRIKASAVHKMHEEHATDSRILSSRLAQMREQLSEEQQSRLLLLKLVQVVHERLEQTGNSSPLKKELLPLIEETLAQLDIAAPDATLLSQDTITNIFTNYAKLIPSDIGFRVDNNEPVLESALKAGLCPEYGCSNGSCGKCRARVNSGMTRQVRYHDARLTEAEKQDGYIFTCAYTALSDIELEATISSSSDDIAHQRINSRVSHIAHSNNMTILNLKTPPEKRLRFLAGQHIRATFPDRATVTLPVASCPCEDRLVQLHLPWDLSDYKTRFVENLDVGDLVSLDGPYGENTLDNSSSRPIVFIAFRHGFSHLKGLIEQAIALEHSENIHLFRIAHSNPGLYLNNVCRAWADAIDHFHYEPILIETRADEARHPDDVYRFYLHTALEFIENTIPHMAIHDYYCAIPAETTDTVTDFLGARGIPASQLRITTVPY